MSDDALNLSPAQREQVDRIGLAFMAEFLEIEVRHNPRNVDALGELGHVYTQQGRLREGLAVDHQLVSLVPGNPTAYYNLACSQALLGEVEAALTSLEDAVRLGYRDTSFLVNDQDLARLHAEPRFQALVERLAQASERG